MNKAELVEALSQRFDGDKKTASNMVDTMVDTVVRTVSKGEKVSISGFGTFEKRERAARTARNPATGERVRVRKTSVPAFRPGQGFRDVVSGAKKLPRQPAKAAVKRTTEGKATGTRRAGTSEASRTGATRGTTRTATGQAPAKKAAPATARRATATRAPARKAPARKTPARTAPTARRTTRAR